VRRFFRDVDVSAVLTVEALVEQPALVLDPQAPTGPLPPADRPGDGAAAAVAYLVDRHRRYRGWIRREALPAEAASPPPAPPAQEGPTLPATATVQEAIAVVAGAAHPVPVLDAQQQFLGVVSPRRLLRSLAP
jgi:glycine betaine/proline transport system ATP-binding protein